MGNIKGIQMRTRTYYFFDEIINIEDFDKNILKKEKKSYKKLILNLIFIKIKFNLIHLNKILKLHNITVVIISFIQEDGKYYPQVF